MPPRGNNQRRFDRGLHAEVLEEPILITGSVLVPIKLGEQWGRTLVVVIAGICRLAAKPRKGLRVPRCPILPHGNRQLLQPLDMRFFNFVFHRRCGQSTAVRRRAQIRDQPQPSAPSRGDLSPASSPVLRLKSTERLGLDHGICSLERKPRLHSGQWLGVLVVMELWLLGWARTEEKKGYN